MIGAAAELEQLATDVLVKAGTSEPAAASTLAALLSGKVSLPQGFTVVCVLSGGNVDRERLKALL